MKQRLLLSIATAVLVATSTGVWVLACDKDSKTQASAATAKSRVCTAAMAAQCTPAQAAACKAKGTKVVTGAYAVTASYSGDAASAPRGACSHRATARNGAATCPHGAAASQGACRGKNSAATASTTSDEAMPAGYSCGGKGMAGVSDRYSHDGCDACADVSMCDNELKASGALTQVVKLKNGIMYVYTARDPGKVRAVQAAVTHRNDRLAAIHTAGDKAKLCPECRLMRGAMASGKLTREMVSIEGGCLTLVTSTDPSIVSKLHSVVAQQSAARVKI